MKISTRGRYGLRALIDVAINGEEKPVALKDVSERQDISLKYLEQIFTLLRKDGIVRSLKGAQGGYVIGKAPEEITLHDILRVLEGDYSVIDESDKEAHKAESLEGFIIREVWQLLDNEIKRFSRRISLYELVEKYRIESQGNDANMFYI